MQKSFSNKFICVIDSNIGKFKQVIRNVEVTVTDCIYQGYAAIITDDITIEIIEITSIDKFFHIFEITSIIASLEHLYLRTEWILLNFARC
jgi:hypothetical protein